PDFHLWLALFFNFSGSCPPSSSRAYPTRRFSDLPMVPPAFGTRSVEPSLLDASPDRTSFLISPPDASSASFAAPRSGSSKIGRIDRKSTRLHSSHVKSSYAVFCLKKKRTCT